MNRVIDKLHQLFPGGLWHRIKDPTFGERWESETSRVEALLQEARIQLLTDLQSKMPKEKLVVKDYNITIPGEVAYASGSDEDYGFNKCLAEVNTIIEELKK